MTANPIQNVTSNKMKDQLPSLLRSASYLIQGVSLSGNVLESDGTAE